jgi:CubicO group peptidase (beta-lactamase class C family)
MACDFDGRPGRHWRIDLSPDPGAGSTAAEAAGQGMLSTARRTVMMPDLSPRIGAQLGRAAIPGCSIAIVDESGLRWAQGFGLADLASGMPAAPDTVYHLFSGTKLFTAVATLQLAERNLVDIEAPVTRYLPELSPLEGIRIVHLLSHRSGLADTLRGFLAVYFPGERPPSTAEALSAYRIKAGGVPGRRVQYRNVNYALLGEVIARVSGTAYRDYVRANVLAPLGMDVDFDLTDAMRARAATGYIGRWDPMRLALRIVVPDVARRIYAGRAGSQMALHEYGLASSAIGGLVGDVRQFARFVHDQLVGGGSVLSREWTARMQATVVQGQAGIESRDGVGLGWKMGTAAHGRFLNHEGGGAGFTSELRLYPERRIGIALAMNAMRMPRTMKAAHAICEVVAGAGVP